VILKYDPSAADTTAPIGTMRINGGAAVTGSAGVTIDSALTDAHGPALMRFSTDGGATWGSWRDYASTATLTLPAGAGPKTVSGQYEDGRGNVATLQASIVLSAGPPTVSVSGGSDGAWFSRDVTLVFTATAPPGSGAVAGITLSLDGTVRTVWGPQASLVIPAEPNGAHVITYHAGDVLGVSGADQTLIVRMDTRGPRTQGKTVSGRVRRALSLPYLIKDNLSPQATGVTVTIRSGSRRVKTLKLPSRTVGAWQSAKWTPRAKGRYTYVVAARDLAGNRQVRAVAGVVTVR
jgi:hypothetical protein